MLFKLIFLFSDTLAHTVHKDAPYTEIETAVGTVLCPTGGWEGGRIEEGAIEGRICHCKEILILNQCQKLEGICRNFFFLLIFFCCFIVRFDFNKNC